MPDCGKVRATVFHLPCASVGKCCSARRSKGPSSRTVWAYVCIYVSMLCAHMLPWAGAPWRRGGVPKETSLKSLYIHIFVCVHVFACLTARSCAHRKKAYMQVYVRVSWHVKIAEIEILVRISLYMQHARNVYTSICSTPKNEWIWKDTFLSSRWKYLFIKTRDE